MYKTALESSKTAGEASKVRRYDRGLKVRRAKNQDPEGTCIQVNVFETCCCDVHVPDQVVLSINGGMLKLNSV